MMTLTKSLAIAANPNASTTKAADENRTEHENKAEFAAFRNIKTLGDAISGAEEHAGGRALDVSFDGKGDNLAYNSYNVKTYQNNAISEGKSTGLARFSWAAIALRTTLERVRLAGRGLTTLVGAR